MAGKQMSDAEYGRKVREQSRAYWLRYKAIQALKDAELAQRKVTFTEDQIKAEMARQKAKK